MASSPGPGRRSSLHYARSSSSSLYSSTSNAPPADPQSPGGLRQTPAVGKPSLNIHIPIPLVPSDSTKPSAPSDAFLNKPLPQRPLSATPSPTSHPYGPFHQRNTSLDAQLRASRRNSGPFSASSDHRRSVESFGFGFEPRDLDKYPHGHTPVPPQPNVFADAQRTASPDLVGSPGGTDPSGSFEGGSLLRPHYDHSHSSFHTAHESEDGNESVDYGDLISEGSNESHHNDMGLNVELPNSKHNDSDAKRPKSPSNLSSFFGWKTTKQPVVDSPATTFSDGRSVSPMPSPLSLTAEDQHAHPGHPVRRSSMKHRRQIPSDEDGQLSPRSSSRLALKMPDDVGRIDDLLRELREVSTELAHSIKREMDLEDELEKVQLDMPAHPELSRRTSDYFSDSGASSLRQPTADNETKIEALEKMRRKAEQDKAQLRVDMAEKMQEDLNQRRALEMHIKSLEDQLQHHNFASNESSERERQLSVAVDDYKRRLQEEKSFKGNFEDLLAGMREELEAHRLERDNLRDEVVPQLKARVEGLESEAAQNQNLVYENTKMSQELQSLKNENQTLVNARRLQLEMQQHNPRFKTISEEEDNSPTGSPRSSLSRSGSLVRGKTTRARANSASMQAPGAGPESLPERLKDAEEQRDALHRTLKALVLRQDRMLRQHTKQVLTLETERDAALRSTPRRAAFAIEVQGLRSEVNHLRDRATDALEQKWQCEKGLSGIKMDLDRAQQETASLRETLQLQDGFQRRRSDDGTLEDDANLNETYAELQQLQSRDTNGRISALANQVKSQLTSNREIRERMAQAISRGEKEQTANTKKLVALEAALRQAEDVLMAAQNNSEEAMARQEEHVRAVKEAQTEQTKRGVSSPLKLQTGGLNSLQTPTSPFDRRSPRLEVTRSGRAMNVQEAIKTPLLQTRVRELEEAAAKADREMELVVEAMNRAQMEVADLQTQRDEAMRKTRELQRKAAEVRTRV